MSKQVLMNAMDAKRMLAMLYTDLNVSESSNAVENDPNAIYGTYIDDNDVPVSLVVVDRNYTAYLGAALTLVPPATANDMAASGQFNDIVIANVREIMNILSRLYMEGSSPHLRFAEIRMSKAELKPAEQAVLDGVAARLDMSMDVPGYGAGLCSLVTL